jgi:hypothetical protein
MVPALILVVLLLFVANIYYRLISKRSRARKALEQLTPALRKRENVMERFVGDLPSWPIAPEVWQAIYRRSSRLVEMDCPDEEKVMIEPELQRELTRRFEELSDDPDVSRDPRFLELVESCKEVEDEVRSSAVAYNEHVSDFNIALKEWPGRAFARLANLHQMGVMQLPPSA